MKRRKVNKLVNDIYVFIENKKVIFMNLGE